LKKKNNSLYLIAHQLRMKLMKRKKIIQEKKGEEN
jgi:hypothetical protein